jgi:hypothetical protein
MRKSTLLLSAALLSTAAASSWLWRQLNDERALTLDLKNRVAALERPRKQLPVTADAPAAVTELPAARTSKAMTETRPSVPVSAPPANYYPGQYQQRLLKNPEFRQALRNQQRVAIESQFRDLPKVLNLSPEDADRVFDLLAEQSVRLIELQGRGPWSPDEGQSRQDSHRELRKQNEAELAQLLGGPNLNRFQEFRSTLQSRAEVDSVRNEMALGTEPLREDQVEPMVLLVNSELQRMNQELRDLGMSQTAGVSAEQILEETRSELAIAANQRIIDAARPILTSTQLAALKELYRRQRLQMEAQTEMLRLRADAAINYVQAAPN